MGFPGCVAGFALGNQPAHYIGQGHTVLALDPAHTVGAVMIDRATKHQPTLVAGKMQAGYPTEQRTDPARSDVMAQQQ